MSRTHVCNLAFYVKHHFFAKPKAKDCGSVRSMMFSLEHDNNRWETREYT